MRYSKVACLVFGVSLICAFSCSKEDKLGSVEFNFKLLYDGTPLVAGETYDYALGFPFIVTKYSMFLSEIDISNSDSRVSLADVLFLDLAGNQSDSQSAQQGTTVRFSEVPEGDYSNLQISLGLPESMNSTNPSDYASESSLANTGEYWEGWESYIFHKLEGRMDTDDDGELETGIALHIGSNDAYRTKQIEKQIIVNDGETTTVDINIDLKDVLMVDGTAFDLMETPQVHHLGVLPKVLPIMDNLLESL